MFDKLAQYPLLDAILRRRSHRFARGTQLKGGPLQYESTKSPQPLTLEEEAALAFAACGITGYALADLPYETGNVPQAGGGNIMTRFVGRSVASADALQNYTLFVINDDGVWMVKRPQDLSHAHLSELIELGRTHDLVDFYLTARVQISDRRASIPREIPFTPGFNKWSANVPGTTYFLPVAELTAAYINGLLFLFDEDYAGYILDDHNWFQPAGLGKFARSRGGYLRDDPKDGRIGPMSSVETTVYEFATAELGGILQNLGLMTQALGLGGFTHFAAHPFVWLQALGFRIEKVPASRIIGAGALLGAIAGWLGRDVGIPTAVGLEHNGAVLIKPYCPPYYRNMEQAVLAFIESKYAEGTGTFRDDGAATAWRDPTSIQSGIPRYSDKTIAATVSFCEYVYKRYGRFPVGGGPFRTLLAYQAHHLDEDFYDRFYRSDALSDAQRTHHESAHKSA